MVQVSLCIQIHYCSLHGWASVNIEMDCFTVIELHSSSRKNNNDYIRYRSMILFSFTVSYLLVLLAIELEPLPDSWSANRDRK
jgi:hypothetical protein